eukprot:jgi/Bigna1/67101/fgenesh1_pg.3_\
MASAHPEPQGPITKILRTPESCFDVIPKTVFPFAPHYVNSDVHGNLRIHFLDEGNNPGVKETILCMHGEPSWCFLYRHMIPGLVRAGYRVVCPDLPGFGKSDKPSLKSDYSYERWVDWMCDFVVKCKLDNVTLFAQDWGGLVGLRVAARLPERFARICISNTGLPVGNLRAEGKKKALPKAFLRWATQTSQKLPKWSLLFKFAVRNRSLSKGELDAYDAPFPEEAYKAASRIAPQLVPITDMHCSVEENRGALRRIFANWKKPFLTLFGDSDPITKGGEKVWQKLVPGARGQRHCLIKNGGHFIQEDAPNELVKRIIKFTVDNPLAAKKISGNPRAML